MTTDKSLSRALQDLADVPGPESMADKALQRAKGRRVRGYAISAAGAFAAAAIISLPFLLASGPESGSQLQFGGPPAAEPSANVSAPACGYAPNVPGVKEVTEANWPDYVRATIERLPARSDYVMQSGSADLCNGVAYSVINLGHHREAGHVTVRLQTQPSEYMPVDCASVQAAETNPVAPPPPNPFQVLFCQEGNGFKLVYGIDDGYDNFRVYAIYADGRTVGMESLNDGGNGPTVSAEQLRAIVIDPAMVAFIG